MLPVPHNRIERQIVFNHSFEMILKYEDPNGEYVEPSRLLDRDKNTLEATYEDAAVFVPFFEIMILRGIAGDFSFRLILDGYNDLSSKHWKTNPRLLRGCALRLRDGKIRHQGGVI